jgi:hypothetical protein
MYLVFSAFTSRPVSLLVSVRACVFVIIVVVIYSTNEELDTHNLNCKFQLFAYHHFQQYQTFLNIFDPMSLKPQLLKPPALTVLTEDFS